MTRLSLDKRVRPPYLTKSLKLVEATSVEAEDMMSACKAGR